MHIKNTWKSQKGQSLVEMALILPILLILVMGIIDFGLLFGNYMTIDNASREGARNAVVGKTDTQVTDIVQGMTQNLDRADMKITIYPGQSVRKKGDEVTITVEYDNKLITPIISAIIPNPVHLTAKTVMRME
ncbi:MAG: TadE/TadG family type IV pilus assembly protein [Bacillota bacterium]|nr:TadE/TadG family type IV pilus assembly protein [Bacillota bacterium]